MTTNESTGGRNGRIDRIQITGPEALGKETAGTGRHPDNLRTLGGLAGAVDLEDGTVVCHDCASDDELRDSPIHSNDEFDYPSPICVDCGRWLSVLVLVYEDMNPDLYYRVCMSEVYESWDSVLSIEEIVSHAREEACRLGYEEAEPIEGELSESGAVGSVSRFTESAYYINRVAPKLRKFAGYVDSTGAGTYTDPTVDVARMIYEEDVVEAFREAYIRRATGDD